jgi:glycosyltransferase involved in cell wall biosynthesis
MPEIKSKRICIDARFYRKSTAGVGRYTRGLIHHLQKQPSSHQYTVILTPEDYAEWPKDKKYKNWATKVLNIPIYSRPEQVDLLSYLSKEQFDLVHFTMFNHPLRYKGEFVVTIHDLTMSLFPLRPRWHYRTWAYRYVMWHAAQASAKVIVPSQATAKDITTQLKIPKDKITVTYEAVEPEFQPEKDQTRFNQLRKKYGIMKPFLFFVNTWRPHKGLPDLIQAYETVKSKHDIQLLISGKPNPSFPQVIQAVEEAKHHIGDILTPGFIPDRDIISLYSMAKAFVFPSHYEGFGLGALEAITCGCPTISAKNSSLLEVLGDAALFYETGNIRELAKSIDQVITDEKLRDELKKKGFERAKKFSFDTMALETLAVYDEQLTHKSKK